MAGQIALNKPSGGQLILSPEDGTSTETVSIPAAGVMAADVATGKILQVVQTQSQSVETITGTSFTTLNTLTTSITPTSADSKILVIVNINYSATSNAYPAYKIKRDGETNVGVPAENGTGIECTFGSYVPQSTSMQYRMELASYQILDTPNTTNSVEYSVKVSPMRTSSHTYQMNRSITTGDDNQFQRTTSTMTLMEVAA